jgi:asparagine synthase (glutamine-hydrolysing)
MLALIAHRGPDDEQTLESGPVCLGHRRLSIIDVSGGRQPISNEDGRIWIVYNGETYNHQELRTPLERAGHRFMNRSDTEVIVHLYEELGTHCLERLNGIYAFAIWDSRSRELLLARDPFGVKPLYYADHDGTLSFASEIKALLADPALSRDVDATALDWLLTYRYVPAPRTLFTSIRKLPPGHFLVANAGGVTVRRFTPPGPGPALKVGEADAVAMVQDAFDAAVRRQMMSDVPIGAFLSGGVDSGAIVAAMAEHSTRVRTYTVGFGEGGQYNELAAARDTARRFGTDHHELLVSADEYFDALPEVIWHLDEPSSSPSALPLYFLARMASRDVKVALAGQGADEPFAGYTRYVGERYRHFWTAIPAPLRGLMGWSAERLPRSEVLKRGVRSLAISDDAERFLRIWEVLPDGYKQRLLRPEVRDQVEEPASAPLMRWLARPERAESTTPLARLQYVDARTSLADDLLLYGDKMTMAHGVEMRVPFLDLNLMQLVERLPTNLKLKGLRGKHVWKLAARRWLPPDVIGRRKLGFAAPIDPWFRGGLSDYVAETLLGDSSGIGRYLEPAAIKQLLDDHRTGRQNNRRQLFSLLCFALWHRQFVEAGATPFLARRTTGVTGG